VRILAAANLFSIINKVEQKFFRRQSDELTLTTILGRNR